MLGLGLGLVSKWKILRAAVIQIDRIQGHGIFACNAWFRGHPFSTYAPRGRRVKKTTFSLCIPMLKGEGGSKKPQLFAYILNG